VAARAAVARRVEVGLATVARVVVAVAPARLASAADAAVADLMSDAVGVRAALLARLPADDLARRAVAAAVGLVERRVAREVALTVARALGDGVLRRGARAVAAERAARVGRVGVVLLAARPALVEAAGAVLTVRSGVARRAVAAVGLRSVDRRVLSGTRVDAGVVTADRPRRARGDSGAQRARDRKTADHDRRPQRKASRRVG